MSDDQEMRAALRAFSDGHFTTYCAWLKKRDAKNLRAAGEMRTNVQIEEESMKESFAAPDPWAKPLAELKAVSATDLSRFEAEFKATRMRELEREHAALDARMAADPGPRLTAAELAKYAAPSPYDAGLKAMKEAKR